MLSELLQQNHNGIGIESIGWYVSIENDLDSVQEL